MDLADFLVSRLLWLIPLILSITVHEWAHAASANWLGDDTARLLGRNTLNPLSHIDPVGTLLLPLLGIPFGWAKPVPINPVRFRRSINLKLGVLLVAIAGPFSNVCLAAICFALAVALPENSEVVQVCSIGLAMNVALAMFNLLPIPPLDGSRVVDALIPTRFRPAWNVVGQYGIAILLALFLVPPLLMKTSLINELSRLLPRL